jgi:glycosyltransferase involved in cell wall biosynthesis
MNAPGTPVAPIRVSVVTMSFPWPSETFASRDFLALQKRDITIEVHPLRPPRPPQRGLAEQQRAAGIPVKDATLAGGLWSVLSSPARMVDVIRLAWRITFDRETPCLERLKCLFLLPRAAHVTARIVRDRPDVLHLYWGHYPSLVLLLARRRLARVKLTMFLGAYDLERSLGASRWAAASCDTVFTHAHANVPDLRRFLGTGQEVVVVHRGIDLTCYPTELETVRPAKPGTVFSASRMIPNKGVDLVIRAFHDILPEHPGASLRLAGDGPQRRGMEDLVKSLGIDRSVEFLGWLSEDQIREELLQAKIFLSLSRKAGERLPNAVKEAMAAGCVCVVLDAPGMNELIVHGVDGYIVPADEPRQALDHMRRHIAVPRFEDIQRAAADKIRSRFDVSSSAAEYARRWRGR